MWALELTLAVLLLVVSGALALSLWRLDSGMDRVATGIAQLEVIAAENARLAKSARDVARAVDTTTAAVEIGTNIVRASHQAIAAIPFGVLESIPATRATSKFVRGIHDGTSAGVYKAISGVNKAIGNAVRDAMATRTGAEIAAPVVPVRIEVERVDPVPVLVTEIEPEVPVLELEPAPESSLEPVVEPVVEPALESSLEPVVEPALEIDSLPAVDAVDPVAEDTGTEELDAAAQEDRQ